MSTPNMFACLATGIPEIPAPTTDESAMYKNVSPKMLRKMMLSSEVSFESMPTTGTSGGNGDDFGFRDTVNEGDVAAIESEAVQEVDSTSDEQSVKANDHEAEKKAKKAIKKQKQKIRKRKAPQDGLSEGISEVAQRSEDTQDEVDSVQDLIATVHANTTLGSTTQSIVGEDSACNPDQVHPGSTEASTYTDNFVEGIVVPAKNTAANKRKKENRKKAREAKLQAQARVDGKKAQDTKLQTRTWTRKARNLVMAFAGGCLVVSAPCALYLHFHRG